MTDHVWNEVLIGDQWIAVDSCEGVINKPSMYESGWGKDLSYIVAVSLDDVVDVTARYTRKFGTQAFQDRRRAICSSELTSAQILSEARRNLRGGLSKARFRELQRLEAAVLDKNKETTGWTDDEKHGRGRESGSLLWKLSRQEMGSNDSTNETTNESKSEETNLDGGQRFHVEQFYPARSEVLTVSVFPGTKGIVVNDALCDLGDPYSYSIVVIDEGEHWGCILQCRSFKTVSLLAEFISSIPSNRIVAIRGNQKENEDVLDTIKQSVGRLGGFTLPTDLRNGVLFVGQVDSNPRWSCCQSDETSSGFTVRLRMKNRTPADSSNPQSLKLRTEYDTVPAAVGGRLPDSVMLLSSQLEASHAKKHSAFLEYADSHPWPTGCVGYCTKKNAPVYLLTNRSFPLEQRNSAQKEDSWRTVHYLPEHLVPDNDNNDVEQEVRSQSLVACCVGSSMICSFVCM